MVTATNNFEAWCGKNGRRDVLAEWAHPDKAPQEFLPAFNVRVPWTCGTCGHGWVTRVSATSMAALAIIHFTSKEHVLAVEWLTKVPEAGMPKAMYNLGAANDEGMPGLAVQDYPAEWTSARQTPDTGLRRTTSSTRSAAVGPGS